jgi:hypothetical protein
MKFYWLLGISNYDRMCPVTVEAGRVQHARIPGKCPGSCIAASHEVDVSFSQPFHFSRLMFLPLLRLLGFLWIHEYQRTGNDGEATFCAMDRTLPPLCDVCRTFTRELADAFPRAQVTRWGTRWEHKHRRISTLSVSVGEGCGMCNVDAELVTDCIGMVSTL